MEEYGTGAMGALVPMLEELLKEYNLRASVKKSIKCLMDELLVMRANLVKVSNVPPGLLDGPVRRWVQELRKLSYDIYAKLNAFMVPIQVVELTEHNISHLLKRTRKKITRLKCRHEIPSNIKDMLAKVMAMKDRYDRYRMQDIAVNLVATMVDPCEDIVTNLAGPMVDPCFLAKHNKLLIPVGIEEAIDELTDRLLEGDNVSERKPQVLSIVGGGGLGKTTLAKAVYAKLNKKFDCGGFVRVGRSPDTKKVLRDILHELGKKRYMNIASSEMDLRQLSDVLTEFIAGRRYLLVIDDLWDISTWEMIERALVGSHPGSRIIITTRLLRVGDVHCIRPLSYANSKQLFSTRTSNCESASTDEVIHKFLKKCGGVPFTIITIASLLVGKRSEDWSKVYDAIDFGHDDVDINTKKIVHFSYYDLPSCLKICLLYMNVFPRNYLAEKNSLIWRWVSEGFVPDRQGVRGSFEIGEIYFNILVNRSMIQWIEPNHVNTLGGCHVDNMVMDFINDISRYVNFVTIRDMEWDWISSCYRLALHKRSMNHIMKVEHMRSFIAIMCHDSSKKPLSLTSFKVLRVLVLEKCEFLEGCSLKHLGKLVQLRYLGLVDTNVIELPREIGRDLKFLQTLDVRGSDIEELPASAGELTNLMCLCASQSTRMIGGVGKLTSLEELRLHSVDKSPNFFTELGKLTKMRILDIHFNEIDEEAYMALVDSLCHLRRIQTLQITSEQDESLQDEGGWEKWAPPLQLHRLLLCGITLPRRPLWMDPVHVPHLSFLSFQVKVVEARDLQILGKLSELVCLCIKIELKSYGLSAALSYTVGSGEFKKLASLKAIGISIICEEGALPMLCKLECCARVGMDIGLVPGKMPLLEDVTYLLDCKGSSAEEVAGAEAALWHMTEMHPNHPTLKIMRYNYESSSSNDPPGDSTMQVPTRVSVALGIVGPSRTSDVSAYVDDVSIQGRGQVKETAGPMSALLGAMRPLLGKLDMMLLVPPQGCSKRVKDGMCHLKDDVEELSSYLDELSEVEDPPPIAKSWMNEARDLSYDMDDYIDSLYVSPAGPSLVTSDINTPRSHHKLASHVKTPKRLKWQQQIEATLSEFRVYVQEAIKRHEAYVLSDSNIKSTLRRRFVSVGPMLPTSYEETADIVINGRMNEFIYSLANDADQQLKVLCVLGSACLGKTTLARVLYNKFASQYDCRAFIRVAKKPDMKRIFCDMLSQVQRRHPSHDCKEIDLIDGIRKCLQDKRYLIIMDDVWAASVWDIISHALPKGSHGSRIIITSQIEGVALTCCCYQSEHVFEMKPLDNEYSRKVFFKRLCGSESYCPQQFREVLNEIVELCGGLPLAIISIASLIASQPVIPTDLLTYIHHFLSSCFLSHSTSDRTRQVLNLSFNNLPHYLKTCLMYLVMYSEGHTFCKDDMVKEWVAEGFIDTTEGQDVEKIAGGYLDQLIGRRFIQPICINYIDEVVSFAVHDAVHDLIAQKSSEENFIVAIDYSRKNVSLSYKVRRLSLLFGDARYAQTPTNIRKSQVRSLRFFGLFECMPCIADFKLLRVLNLQLSGHRGVDDDTVDLTGISELLRLRYLKIACDVCIELPDHGLQFLETLDIMDARLACVPWDIHLQHLLHLNLRVERNLLDISIKSLGKLNNLQDLHLTSSSSSSSYTPPSSEHPDRSIEALGSLLGGHGNLKTVVVSHGSSVKNIVVGGASKTTIYWDDISLPPLLQRFELSPHSGIIFSRIPTWVGELGNLCILKIAVRVLRIYCVHILSGLPALTALSLNVETTPIDKIIFDRAGFLVLKYFKLRFMSGIASVEFKADAIPSLWKLKLVLNDIPQMDESQHGTTFISIEHMPGLKEIFAKIGGVAPNADAVSALRTVLSNHLSNPTINVQLVDSFYGDKSTEQKQQPDEILEEEIRDTS